MRLKFLNGKRLFGTRCTNLITKWVGLKFCLRRACTRGKRISVIDSVQKVESDSSASTASRGQQGCKRRRVEQWVRKKRKVNTAEKLTRRTKVTPEAPRLSRRLFLAAAKIAVLHA